MLAFLNQWASLPFLMISFEMVALVFWCAAFWRIVLPFRRWWKCSRYISMDRWTTFFANCLVHGLPIDSINLNLAWYFLGRLQCFRRTFTSFTHWWSIASRSIKNLWRLRECPEVFLEEQPSSSSICHRKVDAWISLPGKCQYISSQTHFYWLTTFY